MSDTTDPVALLLEAGRRVAAAGVSPGSSGNLSVRHGDRIYASGTGTSLGALERDDVAVLTLDGRPVGGARASKETPLHTAFYERNPDHRAVVHLHSPHAVALSCLEPWSERSAVPPLTPYFVMRVGQTPLLPFRIPGSPELGDLVLQPRFAFRAALLANHGQVTSGVDAVDAVDAAIELEEACRIALLTAGHARRLLPASEVRRLAEAWGSPWDADETPEPALDTPPLDIAAAR